MSKKTYLGDGAYAAFDDCGDLVLTTENGLSVQNRIVLGLHEWSALRAWVQLHQGLAEYRAGDRVRYVPYHAHGDREHDDCEDGIVTSVTDDLVFVRYKGETSQGCKPDQLVKS